MPTLNDDPDSLESLDVPEQARKCWHEAITQEGELREEFDKRMRFRAGDQWDARDISARGKDRPAIVVNLLEQPVQQVVNQFLRNMPGGKVSPGDENATPEVAEYLQGRIRHIEYESDSGVAYGTCVGYLCSGGFAYVGLTVDFVAPDSMEQEPRIRTIDDPAMWAMDPTAKEPDGRDARWAIGRQRYSVEEFKRRWPGKQVVDSSFWGEDATYKDWGDGTDIWVGEYWRMTFRKRKLQRFSDGSEGFLDDKEFLRTLQPGVFALNGKGNSREVDYPVITQYLVSGVEVLDETPWLGTRIPIYRVAATEFYADGKLVNKSLISDAIPSNQVYNCSESLKLEAVVLAPKPKWLVTVEQVAGHEEAWRTANTSTDAALFYNGLVDSKGNPVPPPDWKVFVPPVQEFTFVSNAAKEDVKATTGFFDPALGALDPQRQSGKAILALQQQTGQGTAHFYANLSRALKALYEDLIDIDMKLRRNRVQSVRTIDASGKHKLVRINDPSAGAQPLLLSKGRYGVVVSLGPSDKTQQESTSEFIDMIASSDPNGWALIRDIGARLKEPQLGHYAEEIATRWTPPQFANQDPNAPPLPPQAQQAMAMVPPLTQKVQELTQIIQQKKVEEQGRFDRQLMVEQQKYRTEELKAATQIRTAELNGRNDFLVTMMDARVKELEADADHRRKMVEQAHSQAHEAGLAAAEHEHEKDRMDIEHRHERDQSDLDRQAASSLAAAKAGSGNSNGASADTGDSAPA